uniref:Uncharacterized protein n=1 Tax=Anguilla anguilla TaxID=7936 RepID=A0A0E9Q051_ANGAN
MLEMLHKSKQRSSAVHSHCLCSAADGNVGLCCE